MCEKYLALKLPDGLIKTDVVSLLPEFLVEYVVGGVELKICISNKFLIVSQVLLIALV